MACDHTDVVGARPYTWGVQRRWPKLEAATLGDPVLLLLFYRRTILLLLLWTIYR